MISYPEKVFPLFIDIYYIFHPDLFLCASLNPFSSSPPPSGPIRWSNDFMVLCLSLLINGFLPPLGLGLLRTPCVARPVS